MRVIVRYVRCDPATGLPLDYPPGFLTVYVADECLAVGEAGRWLPRGWVRRARLAVLADGTQAV